ncbi:MAG: SDR family oxidoreductase [Myxococcota bacterium]
MARFSNQVVWITGGGSGIGRALALELAKQGASVAVSGRRAHKIEAVAAEVDALGSRGLAVPCDVTDTGAVRDAVARVQQELGGIDVVIANAGFGVAGSFESLSRSDWQRQMDVNVFGLVETVRESLPAVKERKGRIVLIGSVAAFLPMAGSIAYAASKAAVHAIGQTLAAELHGTGVSVTTIHPGFVESEIGQVDNQGQHDPARRDKRPQRFMWTAEKAAETCVRAIHARKRDFVFTGHGRLASFLGRHTPSLTQFLLTREGAKKSASKAAKDLVG